jgi:hypothetical protein
VVPADVQYSSDLTIVVGIDETVVYMYNLSSAEVALSSIVIK